MPNEKDTAVSTQLDQSDDETNLVYDRVDDEPELHFRTYLACFSMILVNFVQVFALQGPPSVVSLPRSVRHGFG